MFLPFGHGISSLCENPGCLRSLDFLQRLTVAEMSIAEEQSKREILMRYQPVAGIGRWELPTSSVFFVRRPKIVRRLVRFLIFLFDKVGFDHKVSLTRFIWQKIGTRLSFCWKTVACHGWSPLVSPMFPKQAARSADGDVGRGAHGEA